MLEKLKDIAIRIHIDPTKSVDHATKVETVIKVLSDISQSYNNYIEIEFLKIDKYRKAFENNKNIFETIKEDLSLLIVDLNYGSFEAALIPNLEKSQATLFQDEVYDWKYDTFDLYKNIVFSDDYENVDYLKRVANRYNVVERNKIFKPLFDSLGDGKDYHVNIKDNHHKTVKKLVPPLHNKAFYTPKIAPKKVDIPIYNTVQVYAKTVKKQDGEHTITKKDLREILYFEMLEHDTYPFKPEFIRYQHKSFILNNQLDCSVEFVDDSYIIKNEALDLIVWGDTRKEVEDAFNFSFSSLYTNYYLEDDSNLSPEAILLKGRLKKIIKTVIDEG
jgi:hypothetical protein